MSKILFISNISNRITTFVTASIAAAHSLNLDFYQAANWQNADPTQIEKGEKEYGIKIKSVPISRNPLAKTNLTAYKELVAFIKKENIDYIHCNTPTGGILGRFAGKKCHVKKVIYEAHGFHFFKGAPLRNWLFYYPVEKWLAHKTDALITINNEDDQLARKKFHLRKGGRIYKVHGVGIETSSFRNIAVNREKKRAELGVPSDAFVLVFAGRLDANKNTQALIHALAETENRNVVLLLCGDGAERDSLTKLAEQMSVSDRVIFAGSRSDMVEIYHTCDALVLASWREGLSRTIMEAMASGLPCVVSRIRGNVDLIEEGRGGFLCDPAKPDEFATAICKLYDNAELCREMRRYNLERIQDYDVSVVKKEILKIYSEVFGIAAGDASVKADPVS